jgi:hypothetical protein
MRSLILVAGAAMLVAGIAGRASAAGPANGPYAWDARGACRDASGAVVTQSLCPARPNVDQSSSKPVACDAPNAAPPSSPDSPPR